VSESKRTTLTNEILEKKCFGAKSPHTIAPGATQLRSLDAIQ
jgi:hypothetical protein